jgi:hypothetical protein
VPRAECAACGKAIRGAPVTFTVGGVETSYHPKHAPPDARAAERAAREAQAALAKEEGARIEAVVSNIEAVHAVRARRGGAGHYLGTAAILRIVDLRTAGLSLRAIASELGIDKATVARYAPWFSRSEAMQITHARWRAEGKVVVPPWRRS